MMWHELNFSPRTKHTPKHQLLFHTYRASRKACTFTFFAHVIVCLALIRIGVYCFYIILYLHIAAAAIQTIEFNLKRTIYGCYNRPRQFTLHVSLLPSDRATTTPPLSCPTSPRFILSLLRSPTKNSKRKYDLCKYLW